MRRVRPNARRAKRLEAIRMLGGECARCRIDNVDVLDIDHINDDGKAHRLAIKAGLALSPVDEILFGRITFEYRLLCSNCNQLRERNERAFLAEWPTYGPTPYMSQPPLRLSWLQRWLLKQFAA